MSITRQSWETVQALEQHGHLVRPRLAHYYYYGTCGYRGEASKPLCSPNVMTGVLMKRTVFLCVSVKTAKICWTYSLEGFHLRRLIPSLLGLQWDIKVGVCDLEAEKKEASVSVFVIKHTPDDFPSSRPHILKVLLLPSNPQTGKQTFKTKTFDRHYSTINSHNTQINQTRLPNLNAT